MWSCLPNKKQLFLIWGLSALRGGNFNLNIQPGKFCHSFQLTEQLWLELYYNTITLEINASMFADKVYITKSSSSHHQTDTLLDTIANMLCQTARSAIKLLEYKMEYKMLWQSKVCWKVNTLWTERSSQTDTHIAKTDSDLKKLTALPFLGLDGSSWLLLCYQQWKTVVHLLSKLQEHITAS